VDCGSRCAAVSGGTVRRRCASAPLARSRHSRLAALLLLCLCRLRRSRGLSGQCVACVVGAGGCRLCALLPVAACRRRPSMEPSPRLILNMCIAASFVPPFCCILRAVVTLDAMARVLRCCRGGAALALALLVCGPVPWSRVVDLCVSLVVVQARSTRRSSRRRCSRSASRPKTRPSTR
jgi:hypothetical protein